MLSVLPDIDVVLESIMMHRGPTHSLITATVAFIPFFILYRKTVLPYFAAFLSHLLIGDFFTANGLQLLWPVRSNWYGALFIPPESLLNITLELSLFIIAIIAMYKLGDLKTLVNRGRGKLALLIPIGMVIATLLFYIVPLIIPCIIYLIIFTYSLYKQYLRKKPNFQANLNTNDIKT
jgi:membrane-bound metal-dependent hydrolase YbcI (DUF457 family)